MPILWLGCGVLDSRILFPPEALLLPLGSTIGVDENTVAWQVNNKGRVIGWTQSHNRPLYRFYDQASEGFVIDTNRENFKAIKIAGTHSVWPMGINDEGFIVGAATLNSEVRAFTQGVELQKAIPSFAFKIKDNGLGYVALKKEGAVSTSATHINKKGVIGGTYVTSIVDGFPKEYACIWLSDTSEYISLHPSEYHSSRVKALNENWVVVQITGGTKSYIQVTNLKDLTHKIIIESPGIEVLDAADLSDNDILVGSKLSFNTGQVGYVYNLKTDKIEWIKGSVVIGKWTYLEFKPYAISNKGIIVGVASRRKGAEPFSQHRAAIINVNIDLLVDITPQNNEAYAEAYDVNEYGSIVGYAGFGSKSGSVENRAFILPPE